ncbi:hypothetical protein LDENG_00036250 [Lucifuga dentata]|nr:hypothetical protein LDENG_00036250 [Lucifuga dentata]
MENNSKLSVRCWGSMLDMDCWINPLAEEPLLLYYEEEDELVGEEFLVSDEDDEEDSCFVLLTQALNSPSMNTVKGNGVATQLQPTISMDMHNVCKCAAEKLNIPWPNITTEAARSHYEGKKLPQAKRTMRQLLPMFPELLEEVVVSWQENPYTSKTPWSIFLGF